MNLQILFLKLGLHCILDHPKPEAHHPMVLSYPIGIPLNVFTSWSGNLLPLATTWATVANVSTVPLLNWWHYGQTTTTITRHPSTIGPESEHERESRAAHTTSLNEKKPDQDRLMIGTVCGVTFGSTPRCQHYVSGWVLSLSRKLKSQKHDSNQTGPALVQTYSHQARIEDIVAW